MTNPTHSRIERPPVVAVLGHIDHGKSTLLDYIRKENTVAKEAGGITQHLSAYEVIHVHEGAQKKLTFLDTPGHEAFEAQRSRGARVADIAILVVSAEDGVKTQTLEAQKAIAETGIPYVVAINKIDSPKANVEKTIAGLVEHSIFLEGRGGSVPYAAVSAKTGDGVDNLLELIFLVAEMSELTVDPQVNASGVVIEAARDPQRGIASTLIIRDGTLRKGMHVAAGKALAPVRIMENENGERIETATVSAPVRITGWTTLPSVGSPFASFTTKKEAEKFSREQGVSVRLPAPDRALRAGGQAEAATPAPQTAPEEGQERVVIPVIIKADAAGSIDAIVHELHKLEEEWLTIKVIKKDVGSVSEADIKATGGDSNAIIVGFNTDIDDGVTEQAERLGVMVQTFRIIYELSTWLAGEITSRKPETTTLETRGVAKVLKIFGATKRRQVVGARLESGTLAVNDELRILRRGAEIGTGRIVELQTQRAPVQEVSGETECGMNVEASVDIAPGDTIEAITRITA